MVHFTQLVCTNICQQSVLRDAKEVLQEQQIERKKKKRGRPRKVKLPQSSLAAKNIS